MGCRPVGRSKEELKRCGTLGVRCREGKEKVVAFGEGFGPSDERVISEPARVKSQVDSTEGS